MHNKWVKWHQKDRGNPDIENDDPDIENGNIYLTI